MEDLKFSDDVQESILKQTAELRLHSTNGEAETLLLLNQNSHRVLTNLLSGSSIGRLTGYLNHEVKIVVKNTGHGFYQEVLEVVK